MARVRAELSEAHGAVFELAGERLAALPTPTQLLAVESFPGIDADRLARMHGAACAALAGPLDVAAPRALGPNEAMADVQRIKGIGPFYAELIVVRAIGCVDVLPRNEPRALELLRALYHLPTGPVRGARRHRLAHLGPVFRRDRDRAGAWFKGHPIRAVGVGLVGGVLIGLLLDWTLRRRVYRAGTRPPALATRPRFAQPLQWAAKTPKLNSLQPRWIHHLAGVADRAQA